MKANKALKRLTKIKALISDVTKRYSASAPNLRDVLQYAEDAVTRAKEAVGLEVSSTAKGRAKGASAKKAIPVQKRVVVKKAVVAPTAQTAKNSTPAKKAAKKRTLKKAEPSSVREVTTKAAGQQS